MKIVLALLVVATTGCLIVPKTATTTRAAGQVRSEPHAGASRGLVLTTEANRANVTVHVARKRDCSRDVFEVTEVIEHRSLGIGGAEDPRARVFGVFLAPLTVPVSLIVSGLSLAGDRERTHTTRRLDHQERFECTEPGRQVGVEITLASGTPITGTTDGAGALTFQIPEGEPFRGVVVIRAETASKELKYKRRVPAVTAVRDAVTSCAAQHALAAGPLSVRVAVNATGRPTNVVLDRGDAEVTTCITQQIAQVAFADKQRDKTLVMPFYLGE